MASQRKRTSIRPTPQIMGFLMLCAGMFYAGVSQSNNAAFVIGFVVSSMVVMSALQGRGNLRFIHLKANLPGPVFAGTTAELSVEISNTSARPAFALRIRAVKNNAGDAKAGILKSNAFWHGRIPVFFPQRGIRPLPPLEVGSVFPMAFFEFRRIFSPDQTITVYPELRGSPEYPAWSGSGGDGEAATRNRGGDDFAGVRSYLPGESQRHVDWKAVARGAPLMVKEFDGGWEDELHLSLASAPQADLEGKLSQLALWVMRAGDEGVPFSLALPAATIATGSGPAHRNACLEALALVTAEEYA